MRKIKYAITVFAMAFALAGCGGSASETDESKGRTSGAATSPSGKAGSAASAPSVVMELIQFRPATVEVPAGTTVTWKQQHAGAHTVTSGRVEQGSGGVTQRADGKFDSGEIGTGDTFQHEFSEPGTYPYFCSIHPATMRGEVRVN